MQHRASHRLTPHRGALVGSTGMGLLRASGNSGYSGTNCSWHRAPPPGPDLSQILGELQVLRGQLFMTPSIPSRTGSSRVLRELQVLGGQLFIAPSTPSGTGSSRPLGRWSTREGVTWHLCCPGLGTREPLVPRSPTPTHHFFWLGIRFPSLAKSSDRK